MEKNEEKPYQRGGGRVMKERQKGKTIRTKEEAEKERQKRCQERLRWELSGDRPISPNDPEKAQRRNLQFCGRHKGERRRGGGGKF